MSLYPSSSGILSGIATTCSTLRSGHLKREILRDRYHKELRPNLLAQEDRCDLTLALWLESWPL